MANRVRFVKNRRLVSISEAARYAGVSRWSIHAWIRAGKLPFHQFPGTTNPEKNFRGVKIDLNDVDILIDQSKDHN